MTTTLLSDLLSKLLRRKIDSTWRNQNLLLLKLVESEGLDQKDNFQFVRNTEDFYTSFEKLKDAGASSTF